MPQDTPIKNHEVERHLFLVRATIAALVMGVLAGVLVATLSYLQIFKHNYYSLRSDDNRTRVQVVPPVRGLIYDRNGIVLADNLPAYRLEIVPEQIDDLEAALDRLARVVSISEADRQRFRERRRGKPAFRSIPIRLNLSKQEVARFSVNQRQFPGMEIRAGLTRHYPLGKAAAHLVGYVGAISESELRQVTARSYRGTSHIGKLGVEKNYEARLHGEPGSRVVETNAAGRSLRQIALESPSSGESIHLTVDADLQQTVYQALEDRVGSVVALDPRTGGVLAMASRPSFKPELFVDGIDEQRYQSLLNNPRRPLISRALSGEYPPGSTIKPIMALAALETNTIDPERQVWCPGYITLPGSDRHWRDWKRGGHGWVDLGQAIYRSSDVYFYKLGQKLGIDTMHRFGTMFGLGQKTGIDLPGEDAGLMPSRTWKHGRRQQRWFPGETLNTVIGQGYVSATPLQLARMTALIATRGESPKPHVLKRTGQAGSDDDGPLRSAPDASVELSEADSWQRVTRAMEKVVHAPRGTAHHHVGGDLPYRMAGKSGTSQVTSLTQNRAAPDYKDMERHNRDHALFVAFAPAAEPRIAVAVVLEHAGGGSSNAGPVAREVIDAYLLDKRVARNEAGS